MRNDRAGFSTRAIHAGYDPADEHGALTPPVHLTSTFAFESAEAGGEMFAGTREGHFYLRISNPTTDLLERRLASLEGGEAAVAEPIKPFGLNKEMSVLNPGAGLGGAVGQHLVVLVGVQVQGVDDGAHHLVAHRARKGNLALALAQQGNHARTHRRIAPQGLHGELQALAVQVTRVIAGHGRGGSHGTGLLKFKR